MKSSATETEAVADASVSPLAAFQSPAGLSLQVRMRDSSFEKTGPWTVVWCVRIRQSVLPAFRGHYPAAQFRSQSQP